MSYFDESGNIRSDLLDEKAENQAKKFVKYDFNRRRQMNVIDEKKSLSSAQMRRFFGEFRQLEKRTKALGFEKVKPLIKMTKSKASYAANRPKPIPNEFKDFIVQNVNKINTKEEFEAFMLHFEAVVGFFYGIEGVRNN